MTRPQPWLTQHLIRAGHITETGISRHARIRTCARCHTPALVGLDDDICATEAATDPTPLNPLGEALALIDGRRTWNLTTTRNGYQLERRDNTHITTNPAGTHPRQDTLAEHRCHHPPPPPTLTTPSHITTTHTQRPNATTPAPF